MFKDKFETIAQSNGQDILTVMFIEGLLRGSVHQKIRVALRSPAQGIRHLWDYDTLRKIQRASKYAGLSEASQQEDEEAPDGILFLLLQFRKAIEYERPDWGFFYLVGEAFGYMNAGKIKTAEFNYLLEQLPVAFVEQYAGKIITLCDFFDEKRLGLHLTVEDKKVGSFFTDKTA